MAFQPHHHVGNAILGRSNNEHVEMIFIKANGFDGHTGHTAKQRRQCLADIGTDTRLQYLLAVFADPHDVVLQIVHSMGGLDHLYLCKIPPQGSFIHG